MKINLNELGIAPCAPKSPRGMANQNIQTRLSHHVRQEPELEASHRQPS